MSARRLLLFLAILLGSAAPAPAPGAEPEAKLDPDSAEAKEFVRRMKTEVTRFGFEEPTAVGPSRAPLPGEWERYLEYLEFPGPADPVKNPVIPSDGLRTSRYFGRYPEFLAVEVVDLAARGTPPEAVHGGRRAVRLSLAGSRLLPEGGRPGRDDWQDLDLVAIRRRIPLEVNPEFAYLLTGWVRLENVRKAGSYARLGIEWLDAEGRRIGDEIQWSEKVTLEYAEAWRRQSPVPPGETRAAPAAAEVLLRLVPFRAAPGGAAPAAASGWVPVPDLRVNEVPAAARAARVWCEACGHDPDGFSSFDDIELLRRPKVTVLPEPAASGGIFAPEQTPALRLSFQGLSGEAPALLRSRASEGSEALAKEPAGYLRAVTFADLFGHSPAALERAVGPKEVRGGSFQEILRLDELQTPGAYAVQISLLAVDRAGRRTEIARRTLRLVKLAGLAPEARPEGGLESAPFGVDVDLYGSNSAGLLAAIERLGVGAVGVRLWAEDHPGEALAAGRPEKFLQDLQNLAARRYHLEGVLAPVPRRVREGLRDSQGARALYRSDAWKPLLAESAGSFLPYLSAWRLAAPGDRSLGESGFDRLALAGEVRRELDKRGSATGQVMVVPVGIEDLAAPAPAIAADGLYRELVCVPAAPGAPGGLARRLAELFPAAAPGGEPAPASPLAGREWFLELREVGENPDLGMEAERRQVEDLARKVTALAAAGGGRCFVELADSRNRRPGQRLVGLLGPEPELGPRPAYAAWRTLAANLAGARCLGEFDLAPGVSAWAFERGGRGLVVFWTDGPKREVAAQLGTRGSVRLLEITGASRSLRAAPAGALEAAELVPLSTTPAILSGLDPAFIRTRLGFRLAAGTRVECRYQPQEVSFELRNHFASEMEAKVFPRFLPGSAVVPRFQRLSLKPGERAQVVFSVRPSFVETGGDKDMAVDLYLSAKDRREALTITRKLRVESAISLTPSVSLSDDGRTASIQLTAGIAEDIKPPRKTTDLEVYLTVPGLARQRANLADVKTGKSLQLGEPFTVTLIGRPQTVYAGARERNGDWFANVEIELPAAGAPEVAERR